MTVPDLQRIDGIFNSCDRWCERCAFTTRCTIFAIEIAAGMCDGDRTAAMELVIAPPPPMTPEEERRREKWVEAMNACNPTDAEVEECSRQEEARAERLDESPAISASIQTGLLMDSWFESHDGIERSLTGRAAEALEVASWDHYLIRAKLHRAVHGLDEYLQGESSWEDPVQNDWNGTAKLTLICITRSIEAWQILSEELRDQEAGAIANQLRAMKREVERMFPEAQRFVRPGFDSSRGE